jgi:hypothetical protein
MGQQEAEEGNVTIQLGTGSGGAKSVSAAVIPTLRYELEFRGPGGELIPLSVPPGVGSIRLTLALGQWTVTAKAYNPGNELTAAGKTTVTVTPGGATAAIPMGSSNANLSGLVIDPGLFFFVTPAFNQNILTYTVTGLLLFSSNIDITATTADSDATITINGAAVSSGTLKTLAGGLDMLGGTISIPIVVTAQDGMTTKTYTVNGTRSVF